MCGIFGIYDHPEAANLTYLGLFALQHRGQESAGIVSTDGNMLYSHKQMGLVADIFKEDVLDRLKGASAIGHVRYSTSGESFLRNAQPFTVESSVGGIAISHNGNLVNVNDLRNKLERRGSIFQSTMDTEVIIHLIAVSKEYTLIDRIKDALSRVKGAYSLLFLTKDRMIAARDPYGFRPIIVGKLKDSTIISSESCALDLIDAEYQRELKPGEILVVDKNGITSHFLPEKERRFCIFELIYFSRPDSFYNGESVYSIRKKLGRQLAIEKPADVEVIIPVPDSGIPAAIGYSEESKIPFEKGLMRNHYIGRTFIEPRQSIRHFGIKIKINPVRDSIENKRVAVIDDSIVRGTTSPKIIRMIRNGGAREVHMRISSPQTTHSC
ncbi:MAG: amidophosphoribosyltransferase, partial [Thermodesulfobacteriota bacterium]|nr:amidophosphoribosyltransferase [Thermodesulfobacteriota bacterium]